MRKAGVWSIAHRWRQGADRQGTIGSWSPRGSAEVISLVGKHRVRQPRVQCFSLVHFGFDLVATGPYTPSVIDRNGIVITRTNGADTVT
ncbi:MAG: hypothetical protein R2788_07400 [Saprospiraceae bacterium]